MRREVARLVREAKKMEGPGEPRKHHLVPESYLIRWAVDGRVQAVDLHSRRAFPVSPGKAARDTDFYRVESDDLNRELVPPLLFEKLLSVVEGGAVPSFDAAIARGLDGFTYETAFNLAMFIAFQLARGHRFRSKVQAAVQQGFIEMYRDVSEEGMRHHLGGNPSAEQLKDAMDFVGGLRTGDTLVEEQQAKVVWMIGEFAESFMPHLMGRQWHVLETAAELITADEPVLLLGGPGWPRGRFPAWPRQQSLLCRLLHIVS